MVHVHNNPGDHDLSVSAYIIYAEKPDEPKLLLHNHKRLKKLYQPGGHVELNETPWRALGREVLEETGYALVHLKLLHPKGRIDVTLPNPRIRTQPVPFHMNVHPMDNGTLAHYHIDMSYAFEASSLPRFPVQGDESKSFRWVTLEEIKNIPDTEISTTARAVGAAILEAYQDGLLSKADIH